LPSVPVSCTVMSGCFGVIHTSCLVMARAMPTGFARRSRRRLAHAYRPLCAYFYFSLALQ
jgi:hypothetical protein